MDLSLEQVLGRGDSLRAKPFERSGLYYAYLGRNASRWSRCLSFVTNA